ncbi:NAD(P)-binding protein [Peniophora sp. CONT]|nr:NAD(P)-binding protein [Peniophora sp. CONT]
MTGRIALTGATGGLGREVLKHILSLVPHEKLLIVSPSPERVHAAWPNLPAEVEVRKGDYKRPDTLPGAFAGASTLLLVSYPSIAHAERVKAHTPAIDAAKAAGIKRVIYTSLAFGGDSKAGLMQAHLDTEAYLRASGLEYTIIREGLYSESFPLYFGFFDVAHDTDVYVAGDGPIAWAGRADLGEATARIIADGLYLNETILLSGPTNNVLTFSQLAELCSSILSRPVKLHVISVDEYVAQHTNEAALPRGDPEFLKSWVTCFPAIERGETGVVTPLLEDLLGRPAIAMEDYLKELASGKEEAITQYAK